MISLQPNTINRVDFQKKVNNKEVDLYSLKNSNGIELLVSNQGLRVISLWVPDKNGVTEDVVLGFSNLNIYNDAQAQYFGSVIGPYANRIEGGTFELDGQTIQLDTNEESNHLHGGAFGFHHHIWDVIETTRTSIQFRGVFPNETNGYPSNLRVEVTYSLTDENEFGIEYSASSDRTTVLNLTHHSYFNLKGEGKGNIHNHLLTLNSDFFLPVNSTSIPTGKLMAVENTPFDFRNSKSIGDQLRLEHQQLELSNGFDHTLVVKNFRPNSVKPVYVAKLEEPTSGRMMEVYTTEPGVQLYTGNSLDGSLVGKSGKAYHEYSGLCLETQHFPNSPNQMNFPSTIVRPGEIYSSITTYKFSHLNS